MTARARIIAVLAAALVCAASAAPAIDTIPERSMVSKGGVLYPQIGDATQERFQTPPNVKEFLAPGMLIGVLPDDCVSASSGAVGEYYRCDHNFALKQEVLQDGRTVYQVIEMP